MQSTKETPAQGFNRQLLLAYVADLELEVDRLRKQGQFLRHEAREMLGRVLSICHDNTLSDNAASTPETVRLANISQAALEFDALLRDLHEPSGYHPVHDQVIAVAIRPLIEQVFRWQQRLLGVPQAVLRMELASEHVEWFPARLRHILDNLISNALKYSDPTKGETRVLVGVNRFDEAIELRVTDNGIGMSGDQRAEAVELFYRSAPARVAGMGVGLPVVKLLVEKSGGTLNVKSGEGQGTSVIVVLPRYDTGDFLT
ncbi:MAG: sensor histidine kinase [Planctomycetes bacterium]|nr:sensor histidine kinase [Planctomycetota bacterium]